VFDFFEKSEHRLLYIGRLDYNSEGLLLFTNNGDIARKMELPSTALKRTYKARIFGRLTPEAIQKLRQGVSVDGVKYGCIDVQTDRFCNPSAKNTWIRISICEGKNKEIRKVMEHFGCSVNRLIRIAYGPFELGNLKPGEVQKVSKRDVEKLMKTIF
jgi:23S rRNA pseudouridine2605 synthase